MTMIEVLFEDNSKKKFVVTEETTVGELAEKIIQKLYVQSDSEAFGLYDSYSKGSIRTDHYLKSDEKVPKLNGPNFLLFKKRFFFSDNSSDPVTLHMEYIQLRSEVVRGYYILTERDLLELAAIDMRVTYGNPDTTKHKVGFLTQANQLPKFIPPNIYNTKKPAVWEKLILDEFQRIAFDPINSEIDGKNRYISRLRDMCPDYFGSIFYDVTELTIVEKVVREHISSVLAINKAGLHTFKKNPKGQSVLVRSNSFQEVLGWAVHPPTKTFIYTIPSESEDGIKFTYESPVCDEIPDACQGYVELIIKSSDEEGKGSD